MKRTKDNFSKQANLYAKFRPQYPRELLKQIKNLTVQQNCLWDCGTGNGQVASELSVFFDQVEATDISAKQIENAIPKKNIHYSVQTAEKTNFEAQQFDLITVAQAIHWFDFDAFYNEVKRVAKPRAILAIWGYGLLRINTEIDALIEDYYTNIIGPYWDVERKHIDQHYASIPFPFERIQLEKKYTIEVRWTRADLEGYLNTWSSLQKYLALHDENPVDVLMKKIAIHWSEEEQKEIVFPIFMKIGQL